MLCSVKELFFTDKFDVYYPKYNCLCSREYIEKVLISLGKDELKDILEKEEIIRVNCEFCDKIYKFNDKDIEELFK